MNQDELMMSVDVISHLVYGSNRTGSDRSSIRCVPIGYIPYILPTSSPFFPRFKISTTSTTSTFFRLTFFFIFCYCYTTTPLLGDNGIYSRYIAHTYNIVLHTMWFFSFFSYDVLVCGVAV